MEDRSQPLDALVTRPGPDGDPSEEAERDERPDAGSDPDTDAEEAS